jgi:hypothetical protein
MANGGTGATASTSATGGSGGAGGATSPRAECGSNPSAGEPGVWQNVTDPGINLDASAFAGGDNFGVVHVAADPVRPCELYAFVCYQGVWKSSDYGSTWRRIFDGADWAKPYYAAIDPNKHRDPKTSPALYVGVSQAIGLVRSTDSGMTWTAHALPSSFGDYRYQQIVGVEVDPYDALHIIVGWHQVAGVGESMDGGSTWVLHSTASSKGGEYQPFFVDTGDPATTRKTWLAIPQFVSDGKTLRTIDGGASWIELGKYQHMHGDAQIVDDGHGTLYMGALNPNGIFKSTDYGATWVQVSTGSGLGGGVAAGTTKFLYSSFAYGFGTAAMPQDPGLIYAARGADTAWSGMKAPGMVDGAKRIAVTADGRHTILVTANWHAGIWRYVEP